MLVSVRCIGKSPLFLAVQVNVSLRAVLVVSNDKKIAVTSVL